MRALVSSEEHIEQIRLSIESDRLSSIPPGCSNNKITGLFTMKITTKYLNTLRESIVLRCKFWGMDDPGLLF